MVIDINVVQDDLETLFVQLNLTGLTATTKYDLMRLQVRYLGKDDTGTRLYDREDPDRRELWSSVGYRQNWTPGSTTATIRDYECPLKPTQYFLVPTASIGPHEYTDWATPYPVSRGVLDDTRIDFGQDLIDADLGLEPKAGDVLVRSTADLALRVACCLVDMEGPTYTARGTENAVLGRQFPVFIADTRAARRGRITLKTEQLGQYNDLRQIVFPSDGLIRPVELQSTGGGALLLDDMRVIPLDVQIEQATASDIDLRYVHIDYIEIDRTAALYQQSGNNDSLVSAPVAQFTISDPTPARGHWTTLTDTSSGVFNHWDWTIERGKETDNKVGKFYSGGAHRVRWSAPGKKTVKLRVYGDAGAHTRSKVITVR